MLETRNRHQNDYGESNLPDQSALPSLNRRLASIHWPRACLTRASTQFRMSANEANSHYNSLQVDLTSQVGRDLTLRAFYTLSRTIDPTTAGNGGGDLGNLSNPYAGWKYDNGPGWLRPHAQRIGQFIYASRSSGTTKIGY